MEQFILLAQETSQNSQNWIPTLVQGGLGALLAWYLLTRTVPKITESNEKIITKLSDANDRSIAAFREEAATERKMHSEALEAARLHCERHNGYAVWNKDRDQR